MYYIIVPYLLINILIYNRALIYKVLIFLTAFYDQVCWKMRYPFIFLGKQCQSTSHIMFETSCMHSL